MTQVAIDNSDQVAGQQASRGRYEFALYGEPARKLPNFVRYGQVKGRRARSRRSHGEIYRCDDPGVFSLEKMADKENLAAVFELMRASGGQGPGVDGWTYPDFSRNEM